jgi:hypothetical protein
VLVEEANEEEKIERKMRSEKERKVIKKGKSMKGVLVLKIFFWLLICRLYFHSKDML